MQKQSSIITHYDFRLNGSPQRFNFRDAKQFYRLADFKNFKETQVTNAVNMAFTMTVIGKQVLEKYGDAQSKIN